jgi:drug/metabolite transporter (DMT)-like permease
VQQAGPFLMIIAATVLWGFGFIATKWALVGFGPLWLTVIRYALAFAIMIPVLKWMNSGQSQDSRDSETYRLWFFAIVCGALLAGLMIFQTVGLVHTTATNSAFLTTLYAVFVPMLCVILFRTRLGLTYWLALALAFVGTVLLCDIRFDRISEDGLNRGDWMTVVAALFAAAHIMGLEALTRKPCSIARFNALQYLVTAIVVLPFALIWESDAVLPNMQNFDLVWWGLLFLAGPSTVISFSLQTVAQKHLPATTASLALLMESPFAMLFAFLLLGESSGLMQLAGAGLIVMSSVLVMAPGLLKSKTTALSQR